MSSGASFFDKMALFTVLLFVLIGYCSCDLGDSCGYKQTGKCVLATECEAVKAALKKRKHHNLERCGFQDRTEIVCCNEQRDSFNGSVRSPEKLRKSVVACNNYQKEPVHPIVPFIIGGENASLGEYPHMAALGYEDDTRDYDFSCGGSIISENYVLTAAHCLIRSDQKVPKIVRLGIIDLWGKEEVEPQDIPVEKIIPHENYLWQERVNDIGLLKLSKPIKRTNYVQPICLHVENDDPPELVVCGFGKVGNTRDNSRFLLKTQLVPVDLKTCNNTNRIVAKPVFETQICAKSKDDVVRDTCEGDSGGPMQFDAKRVMKSNGAIENVPTTLVGVTSYGPLCGGKAPSIYTRVSKYLDWIEEKVWP